MQSIIIANPIYDVVFKYLLEDMEITRELLSSILGEEITQIVVKPQETAVETSTSSVSILRFDFKAIIKTSTGDTKFQMEDRHQLDFKGDLEDPLVKKMVDRLVRAIANEDIREKMDVEDEIDRIFGRELGKLAQEKDKIIAEKDLELADKNRQLLAERQKAEAKDKALMEERQKAEEERQKNIALQEQLDVLKKQLNK